MPERAEELLDLARADANARWNTYRQMAEMDYSWAAD